MKKLRFSYALLFISALMLFSFNNCGQSTFRTLNTNTLSMDSSSTILPTAGTASASPTPAGGSSNLESIAGNSDWVSDSNCMTNSNYDTCLIWKNPVAMRFYKSANASASIFTDQSGNSQRLKRGTDLSSITTLAVNIGKYSTASGLLKNSFIDVYASNTSSSSTSYLRLSPSNGKYKFPYQADTEFKFAQLMAFYWINYAREFFENRGATYYSAKTMSGKPALPVDAFNATDSDLINNGYFTWDAGTAPWGMVALGSVRSDSKLAVVDHEVALSAEAYVHEMGHANLFYASGGPKNSSYGLDDNVMAVGSTSLAYICKTVNGCRTAIDEGQADFHSHLIFERQPYFLETFLNLGLGDPHRNLNYVNAYTAQSWYDTATLMVDGKTYKGEVHYMGAMYANILFNIYNNTNSDKLKFIKVFTAHLAMIDQTATFSSMKQALLDSNRAISGTDLSAIISQEFQKKGF